MSEEQKRFGNEFAAWDDIQETDDEDRVFHGFKEHNPIIAQFEEDTYITAATKFGNNVYMFRISTTTKDNKVFSAWLTTSSKRLMLLLKKQLPLKGKTFEIMRIGEGYDTNYKVDPMKV